MYGWLEKSKHNYFSCNHFNVVGFCCEKYLVEDKRATQNSGVHIYKVLKSNRIKINRKTNKCGHSTNSQWITEHFSFQFSFVLASYFNVLFYTNYDNKGNGFYIKHD